MGTRLTAVTAALLLAACVGRTGSNQPASDASPVLPAYTPAAKPAPFPYPVVANAACVLDGHIYVTGGYGNRDRDRDAVLLNHAWRYDPRGNAWERLPDMPEAACFHAMAAAAGRVFVFGGLGEEDNSRENVMAFDPAAGKWSVVARMSPPRNRFAAAAVGDRIYVVAGMEKRQHLENTATVNVFDARTFAWFRAADVPSTGHGHALAAVGQTLIVAGGLGDLRETWLLDTTTDKWRRGAALPDTNLLGVAAAAGDKVYLVGNRADVPIPLLRYDPAADKWEEVAKTSVETHRAAGAALDGFIYVIGGEGPRGMEVARVSRYDPVSGLWSHSD